MKDWLSELRQKPAALYAIGGGGLALLVVTLTTLWVAGAFGGGGEEPGELIACEERTGAGDCPSPSARPTPTRVRKRTPTPSPNATTVTPTPSGATGQATPVFPTRTPTLTPQPNPPPQPTPAPAYGLALDVASANVELMVDLAMIPGKPDEAVVVSQKSARIWRVSLSGAFPRTLYGDLSNYVGGSGNEEGLLSVTFSPNFQSDGRIYVYYTQGGASNLPTVLSRFQVVNDVIDTTNEVRILEVPDFAANHNGGRILFGPEDGYLYLSTGDGGGGGDPQENAQDTTKLLGKVLRLDVTDRPAYSVPPDNPFAGGSPQDDLIYAFGLRNPWRFSFDQATGDLWLGDVGQNAWEEVDRIVRGGNYGWDCYEGYAEYEINAQCQGATFLPPRAVYSHDSGACESTNNCSCSITGGYVYRGNAIPQLRGWYVYGDYCSGKIWAVNTADNSAAMLLLDSNTSISSFAELANGELVILTFDYAIYRLVYG